MKLNLILILVICVFCFKPSYAGICLNDQKAKDEYNRRKVRFPYSFIGVDLGFRWHSDDSIEQGGRCLDQNGTEGLNSNCLGVCGDLSYKNLSKKRLLFWNFSGANFTYSNLAEAYVGGSVFNGAIFQNANLNGLWTSDGSTTRTDAQRANFKFATFKGAVLTALDARGARFNNADMTSVWWAQTDIRYADLRGATLLSPNIESWDFQLECGILGNSSCFLGTAFNTSTKLPFTIQHAIEFWHMKQIE